MGLCDSLDIEKGSSFPTFNLIAQWCVLGPLKYSLGIWGHFLQGRGLCVSVSYRLICADRLYRPICIYGIKS